MHHRFVIALFAAVTAGAGTACLDVSGPEEAVPIEETRFAPALGVDLPASTRTANGAYYRDIVVGTGQPVANGQSLDVRYTGWLANGFQFESNVNAAGPFTFTLGTGNVIQGWHETIPGMHVGGKRQIILPPWLGYGQFPYGPIPGMAVIVFNIEVVAAR